jgi:hypothetical protein
MISNLEISKYSKKEMEDILSLNYPYSNIEIEQQADNMVKNVHRDNKLPQEERKKVSFFIGEIKAFLTLPTSPKAKKRESMINPLKQKHITKTINIDTRFRDNYYQTQSSDFSVQLPMSVKNAVSLQIQELAMQNFIYAVHRSLKNNYFHIGAAMKKILIQDGNYTPDQMEQELNLVDQSGADMTGVGQNYIFSIDDRSQKTTISRVDGSNFDIYFNRNASGVKDNTRSVQEGLGWILGFRFGEYTGSNMYVSEGVYNHRIPEYVFIEVDDNNRNISNNYVGAFNSSMLNNNILARISLASTPGFGYRPSGSIHRLKRDYFGPVNISKVRIRLRDEFGRTVPMNNMDYSFVLKFTCVYEV